MKLQNQSLDLEEAERRENEINVGDNEMTERYNVFDIRVFCKQLNEKSRECHSHKLQPTSDTKRKRKRQQVTDCIFYIVCYIKVSVNSIECQAWRPSWCRWIFEWCAFKSLYINKFLKQFISNNCHNSNSIIEMLHLSLLSPMSEAGVSETKKNILSTCSYLQCYK